MSINTIRVTEDQLNLAAIQALLDENKENTEFIFEQGAKISITPAECKKIPLDFSNTTHVKERTVGLHLDGMKNVALDFNGGSLICEGHLAPIVITDSDGITIQNANIDWLHPLSAEGIVSELSTEEEITLAIDKEVFPYKIDKHQLVFLCGKEKHVCTGGSHAFDKYRKTILHGTGDKLGAIEKAKEVSEGIVKISGSFPVPFAPGTIIVLRHGERDHPALFAENSKNILVDNTHVYSSAGLGFLIQFCENIELSRVVFTANQKKGRKVVNGHDDGFHLTNNRGKILIEGCQFDGLMDDPINVHGCAARIEAIDGNRVKGRFVHEQSQGFKYFAKPGDEFAFIKVATMNRAEFGDVTEYTLDKNRETFTITFEDELSSDIKVGDALENVTNLPDEVVIRSCFFGSCRARGILATVPKVLIEGNYFESAGAAILISGDAAGWYETGATDDVVIRDNVFTAECNTSAYQFGDAVISVSPVIAEPDLELPFHRKIVIENNKFNPSAFPIVYAFSTDRLVFEGNSVYMSNKFDTVKPSRAMIAAKLVKNVKIAGNTIAGQLPRKIISDATGEAKIVKDM
ncbi:alpha-1,3-galactosidase B [Clostridia bacterium]|nr:alpha-1,3-galactosidase B [Clostridia bacterium]